MIKKVKSEFEAKMSDDLNTSHILTGALNSSSSKNAGEAARSIYKIVTANFLIRKK